MAERPIFVPSHSSDHKVEERYFSFHWHSGMAPVQKKKNIQELHDEAWRNGLWPILEISSKSDHKLGQRLSAFSLRVAIDDRELPLESAFQGSKVFTEGGPFQDLYSSEPGPARRDPRLRDSGRIIGFRLGADLYPAEPATGFYDWLYARSVSRHIDWLRPHLEKIAGFSDIEFNPEKSLNCQARSLALVVWLDRNKHLKSCSEDYWTFTEIVGTRPYWRAIKKWSSLDGGDLS